LAEEPLGAQAKTARATTSQEEPFKNLPEVARFALGFPFFFIN